MRTTKWEKRGRERVENEPITKNNGSNQKRKKKKNFHTKSKNTEKRTKQSKKKYNAHTLTAILLSLEIIATKRKREKWECILYVFMAILNVTRE